MKITDNETRWAKIGQITNITFVGKEAIAFGTGCHIIFLNLQTNEELVYTANHQKVGDGVSCFTGHRTQNIFAFAEKCSKPSIFIKTYPNFEEVRVFKDEEPRGYSTLTFTETSLILALGDLPSFHLTVWNWRSGEKLANHNTSINCLRQLLVSNASSPAMVVQMGLGNNKLHLWDIFVAGKKTILTQHIIRVPSKCKPFTSALYTSENALLVLDAAGCVYTMLPGYHLERVIKPAEEDAEGDITPTFAWYKSGLAVLGPCNRIRHYKKTGNWSMDWSLEGDEPLQRIISRMDYLVALTKNSDLLQVLPTEKNFTGIKTNESRFDDFCLIYPVGQYLIALCNGNMLNLYEVATGKWKSTTTLDEPGLILKENPRFPYVAVSFTSGKVVLISAFEPENLTKLTEFHLTKTPIDSIYFNECGTVFVVANLATGLMFIIEGIPGGHINVVAKVHAYRQITSQIIILSENCYRLFCISVTSRKYVAGNRILRFCHIKDHGTRMREYKFKEKNIVYSRMCAVNGAERDRRFYLVPCISKIIREIEIKRGNDLATVVQQIPTGHQMRDIFLRRDRRVFMTWASDGFIIIRNAELTKNVAMALPHHRTDGGVKKAYLDPLQKYLISLGKDRVLVCTNLMETEMDREQEDRLKAIFNSTNFNYMFSRPTTGYIPRGVYQGKCFMEVLAMQKLEREQGQCLKEREGILKEFRSIQEELLDLLEENLNGPENEKLELIEFNLNKALYNQKCRHQKKLKAATEVYLKNLIKAYDQVSGYIMQEFWKAMQVQEVVIRGIFSNFEVKNYPIRLQDLTNEEEVRAVRQQRMVDRYFSQMDNFACWEPIEEIKLKEMLRKPHSLPLEDLKQVITSVLDLDEESLVEERTDEEIERESENGLAFSGSDMYRFLEPDPTIYTQAELITYYQMELQWQLVKNGCCKLKEVFNTKFNATMTSKTKDMQVLLQHNQRLRHIVSEINYFSEKKFQVKIDDPEWSQVENPELVIQVKDDEVPITPYISPSEQALLDAKAAEEERLRLLLLADDFRERALMAMMNGVLEIRWEDELKKDVPKPKCMLEKEPENFNEDDLRVVRDYDEKVAALNKDREKYKNLLQNEYQKLSSKVREYKHKSNVRLGELLYYRLEVDAALSHETLKMVRNKFYQVRRCLVNEKMNTFTRRILENEEIVHQLHRMISSLHGTLSECKSSIEGFQLKEKMLEKAFRKDFLDESLVIQEQATKLYKKRPKISIRSITSTSILSELGKCIMSNAKPPPTLPYDCLEYLKSLDTLDQYLGIPTVVDEHTYNLICKHRRLRIEYEIKLKAAQCELAEAEATLHAFNRRLGQKKEEANKLSEELNKIRIEEINFLENREIQLVVRRGIVEIVLSGAPEDFMDCVLVCREDVENINKVILEHGEKKIKSLQRGMNFKRKILSEEWKHKRLRMLIQDLQEKLKDIKGVKFTKELQGYLKNHESTIPFETEVDIIRASYENAIQEKKDKIFKMQKQMKSIYAEVKTIDQKIEAVNVDVCEMNLYKDKEIDAKERMVINARMNDLLKRSTLIQQVQTNHHEILVLQTELELLRLKTFPTLKYKVN